MISTLYLLALYASLYRAKKTSKTDIPCSAIQAFNMHPRFSEGEQFKMHWLCCKASFFDYDSLLGSYDGIIRCGRSALARVAVVPHRTTLYSCPKNLAISPDFFPNLALPALWTKHCTSATYGSNHNILLQIGLKV